MGKFTFNPKYDEPDVTWDRNDPASVESARRLFNSYIDGESRIYRIGPDEEMTEVRQFDPDHDTLFVFFVGGGC